MTFNTYSSTTEISESTPAVQTRPSHFLATFEGEAMIAELCQDRLVAIISSGQLPQTEASRDALLQQITQIVSHNLAKGRVKRVLVKTLANTQPEGSARPHQQASPSRPEDAQKPSSNIFPLLTYIDRVITTYLKEHNRIDRLVAVDDTEWRNLYDQLNRRAHYALLRQSISSGRAREEAREFAQEACQIVYSNSFPYDVPFDAWVAKILNNLILQRYTRSRDLIDRKPQAIMSLDQSGRQPEGGDHFSLYNLLEDETSASAFEQVEVKEWLLQAIACLRSQAQQQVIIYSYFYDLSDEEIGRRIKKSRNAVQILRHRALKRLQEILA